MPTATLRGGQTIEFLSEMIGDGAMKEVYLTKDRQSVVCFYKDLRAGKDPLRKQRLEAILGKYNPTVVKANGGSAPNDVEAAHFRSLFCWPMAIIEQPRYGFVAPKYPANYFFQSGPPDLIRGREKNGMRFIGAKNRKLLERYAPEELGPWVHYFSFCIQMARAVNRLHMAGLAHSDLSPNNVLVDPLEGRSIVIDIDSLVVPGLFPPDVVGTKGYIAPEVLSSLHLPLKDKQRYHPSTLTDLHALAVLIYQYLLRRHPLEGRKIPNANTPEEQDLLTYGSQAVFCEHPTDASNRPDDASFVPCSSLGPKLSELFTRAFVNGLKDPRQRPAAREWLTALIRTWDLLIPCPNPACSHRRFVVNPETPVKCPFCGARPKGTVPVIRFRKEGRPGQWLADGQLVVHHYVSLFRWHAFDNEFPGPSADKTPLAYCVWHEGKWLLINQNLPSLTSPRGNLVPACQAVELKHGAQFRLSKEPHGRIAEIQIIQC